MTIADDSSRRIVVGVDGSPHSLQALRWAAGQAALVGAVLLVIHCRFTARVVSELIEGAEDDEGSILAAALSVAHEIAPDIEVIGVLEDPPAAKHLIDASAGALLLVVGSRGLGGFKELTLGSVSQQCVHHAHCPVVVVRPERVATP